MPRVPYLACLGFLISLTSFYAIYSYTRVKKNSFALKIGNTFFSATLTMVFYFLTLVVRKRLIVNHFLCFYYASIDWLLFTFFDFIRLVIFKKNSSKILRVFRGVLFILVIADSLSLMFSVVYESAFTFRGVLTSEGFIRWIIDYTVIGYQLHLYLCYAITIPIFLGLLRTCIKVYKFFRIYYIALLVTFASYYILNGCVLIFGWEHDYSIFLFMPLTTELFIIVFNFFQRGILASMLHISCEHSDSAIVCFDIDGECFYINDFGRKIFGGGLVGKESAEAFLRRWTDENITEINQNAVSVFSDSLALEVMGEMHFMDVEYQKQYDYKKRLIAVTLNFTDRTEDIKKINDEHYKATHDHLTGLYNQEAFFEKCQNLLLIDPYTPRYLICTDILNFKLVNDVFGKEMGDKILKFEAMVLKSHDIKLDCCGRIGNDIFCLLMKKDKFHEETILKFVSNLLRLTNNLNYKLSMKIGVYEITNPSETVSSMYDKAHLAIDSIRDDYSKMIAYYDMKIMDQLVKEKLLIGEFQTALSENQFKMYIQPQISATDNKIIGGEALVRWIHPVKGFLSPDIFVKVLEKNGFIYKMDYFIWDLAIKTLAEWKNKPKFKDFSISVNISTKDFYHADLYKVFTGLIQKYNVDPGKLKLEVTETVLVKDIRIYLTALNQLRKAGFVIEMDDFGSGYSSLNALRDFPMDVLKIDMEFLRKTENEERSAAIVKLIIKMAKTIGMKVITEGVEKKDHVEFLKEAGCDIFQGYYFAKPMTVSQFETMVSEAE